MTVEEAYQRYGAKQFVASEGQDILTVSRLIYNSDSETYSNVLRALNPVLNWSYLCSGQVLSYIDASVITSYLY